MLSSVNGNIYDFFVQKCVINGLDPDRVRKDAGVSHQVLSNWKKKDPHTVVLFNKLMYVIAARAGENLINDGWTMANSGTMVNVFDPKPEMFLIEDIAEGLAYKYRWCGQSAAKITVAEHSVRVAEYCVDDSMNINIGLAGLLHDASEAYMSDLPSPIKSGMPDYKKVETKVMACIAERFGFEWPLNKYVKRADQVNLEWEYNFFTDDCKGFLKPVFLHPEPAKKCFLDTYNAFVV